MNVKIQAESQSQWVKVFIDHQETLSGPGEAEIELDENQSHTLTWFVQGVPGQSYTIQILEPENEVWKVSGKLKMTGKATGQHII